MKKSNYCESQYCNICESKLNDKKAFFDEIIKKYNLTPKQQKELYERLKHTNFTNENFYSKINEIIKDIIVDSLNENQKIESLKPKDDFSILKEEFNLKIKKLKKTHNQRLHRLQNHQRAFHKLC